MPTLRSSGQSSRVADGLVVILSIQHANEGHWFVEHDLVEVTVDSAEVFFDFAINP